MILRATNKVNLAIKHAAQEAGASFVALSKASNNHDACSSSPWAFGWEFDDFNVVGVRHFHPNLQGQQASAIAVVESLPLGRRARR